MPELRPLFYKVVTGVMLHKGTDRWRHGAFGEQAFNQEHLKRTEGGNLFPFTAVGAWSWTSAVWQTVNIRQISLTREKSTKCIKPAIPWSALHSLLWNHWHSPEQMWSLLSWLPLVLKRESQPVQLEAWASEDKICNEFVPSMNQAWGQGMDRK